MAAFSEIHSSDYRRLIILLKTHVVQLAVSADSSFLSTEFLPLLLPFSLTLSFNLQNVYTIVYTCRCIDTCITSRERAAPAFGWHTYVLAVPAGRRWNVANSCMPLVRRTNPIKTCHTILITFNYPTTASPMRGIGFMISGVCDSVCRWVCPRSKRTRKLCYRKDDRAMRRQK